MQYKKITDTCTMMKATWSEILWSIKQLKRKIPNIYDMPGVFGLPRGGCPFAVAISEEYAIPYLMAPVPGCLVVDDDIGYGNTIRPYIDAGYVCSAFACMDITPEALKKEVILMTPIQATKGTWLAYPWTSFAGDSIKLLKSATAENKTLEQYMEDKPWIAVSEEALKQAQKALKRSK